MGFKNDYKSAFGSVSPDTEKIIAGVHEKLNENAPTKIRIQPNKKRPVWAIIGTVAGTAAGIALFAVVVFRVLPGFDVSETNGTAQAPGYNYAGGNNAAADEGFDTNNGNNLNGEASPNLPGESVSSSSSNNSGSGESASNSGGSLTPLSFTDEDLELQEILRGLIDGGGREVYSWFNSFTIRDPVVQKIGITNRAGFYLGEYYYYLIPENYKDPMFQNFTFPSTREEMEEIVGRFFTKYDTEQLMKYISKGTITSEENGVLLYTPDSNIEAHMPPYYIEADCRMYHLDILGVGTLNIDWETARVINKSDERIDFTILPETYEYLPTTEFRYEELYYDYALRGFIESEDGEWRLRNLSYAHVE